MSTSFAVDVDIEHRRCVVGAEPMIFHCHHYNAFLQQTLLDANFVDTSPTLRGGGAEVAHAQLANLFKRHQTKDLAQRCAMASELYRWAGFGTVDFGSLSERGGTLSTPSSHYAFAWRVKFGPAKKPVCYFAEGWIAGALAAIHDKPLGTYAVQHSKCGAVTEGAPCVFELSVGTPNYEVRESVGVGPLTTHKPVPVSGTPVNYEGILQAVSGLPLIGDAQGNIQAFGVYLTRHYANYYNRISFELMHRASTQYGVEGRKVVEPLLIEAGHICAFNTFGGIMTSTEWDALIKPTLKTREDWVHGMVAVANALGWGRWQVAHVTPDEAEFVIHDDYESVGYLAMYGKSTHPVSFLAEGGVIGLMNLVYVGQIEKKPELSPLFYDHLFKRVKGYRAEVLASRAKGDLATRFRVVRS